MDIPKEGLVFHGIPENYDYEKGIWYDANSSKNHFKLADSLKPILVRNGKVYGFGANVLQEDIDSSYKFPFIRTFPKAFFELNKNIFGDGNTDRTFIVVVKPYKLDLEREEKNYIIYERNNSSTTNEHFTTLRISNKFFVTQQRAENINFSTRDNRYGTFFTDYKASKINKVRLISKIYNDSINLFINGNLNSFHSLKIDGKYMANFIYIGSAVSTIKKDQTDYSFSGLIYKLFIYNRALSKVELTILENNLLE